MKTARPYNAFLARSSNGRVYSTFPEGNALTPLAAAIAAQVAAAATPAPDQPTLRFTDGFSSGDLSHTENGILWLASNHGNTATTGDNVEVVSGAGRLGHGLVFTYGGNADTNDDAWAEQRFDLGVGLPELTFEWDLYIPDGTETYGGAAYTHRDVGVGTNNKLFVIWTDGDDGDVNGGPGVAWEMYDDKAGGSYCSVHWSEDGNGAGTHQQTTSFIPVPTSRGKWMTMRMYVKTASSRITPINANSNPYNTGDGVIKMWRKWEDEADFSLIHSVTTANIFPTGGSGFRWGYLMGWSNSGFTSTTKLAVDNVRVFTGPPLATNDAYLLDGPALVAIKPAGTENANFYGTGAGTETNRIFYSSAKAWSGGQSLKTQLVLTQPGVVGAQSRYFFGRYKLPVPVPKGYNLWFKASFYFPSTTPMGACFSANGNQMTTTTAASYSGGVSVIVASTQPSTAPVAGQDVCVLLADASKHLTTISAYDSGTRTITLAAALPSAVNAGASIWFRDTALSQYTCGTDGEAPGFTKWMVFSPENSTGRIYMMPKMGVRNDNFGIGWRIDHEMDHLPTLSTTTPVIPRDQWVTFQFQIYVHDTEGFSRAWMDDAYIGETAANTLAAAADTIKEYGIGDYWNGFPWTDGTPGRTDYFFVDDLIVASDYEGFGKPVTFDSGGRRYIAPAARAVEAGIQTPLLFADTFESGSLAGAQNGASWGSQSAGAGDGIAIVDGAGRGGGKGLVFTFAGGATGDDAWAEQRFDLGAVYPELTIMFDIYCPNGSEAWGGAAYSHRNESPSNNKFLRLWPATYDDNEKIGCSLSNNGSIYSTIRGEWDVGGTGVGYKGAAAANFFLSADRGTWVSFKFYARAASETENGSMRIYKNDRLIVDNTLALNNGFAGMVRGWRYGYILGWANSGFASTTKLVVDNVKFYPGIA